MKKYLETYEYDDLYKRYLAWKGIADTPENRIIFEDAYNIGAAKELVRWKNTYSSTSQS